MKSMINTNALEYNYRSINSTTTVIPTTTIRLCYSETFGILHTGYLCSEESTCS